MERYGIQTWDENGKSNNTGIAPLLVLDWFSLSVDEVSGMRFYPQLRASSRINYHIVSVGGNPSRSRGIRVNGNRIIIEEQQPVHNVGGGINLAWVNAAWSVNILVYLEAY
ncbi:hypothetical protein ACE3YX_004869 [Salmonella enterica]|nr:hypothetical protein [Salmonella enterica]